MEMKTGSLCPVCEKGKLKEIRKDLVFTYKGKLRKFRDERVFKCSLCDFEALPREANKRVEKELTVFRQLLNKAQGG